MGLCLKSVVLKQTCNARKGDVVRRTEGERWGVTKWPSNVHQSEVGRSWLIWFHLSCDVQCECLLQSLLSFLLGHPFFPLSEGLRLRQIIACHILIWHFVFDDAFVFAHLIVFVSAESQSVPLLAGGESRWSESARDRLSCWVARAEQPAPLLAFACRSGISIFLQIFCPFFCGFAEDTHPSKCIMQKLREQKIPIWVRAFVSAFSIFQLSFSLLFSVLDEYYSYHRMFPPLPNSLKSKQIVRLSHQSGAPRLHPHCLHRWNFRISPKKELLDECSMGEDVSQCSDS